MTATTCVCRGMMHPVCIKPMNIPRCRLTGSQHALIWWSRPPVASCLEPQLPSRGKQGSPHLCIRITTNQWLSGTPHTPNAVLLSRGPWTSQPGTAGRARCEIDSTYPPGRDAVQLSVQLPAVPLRGRQHRVLGQQGGQQGLQEGLQLLQLAALQQAGTLSQLFWGLWCLASGAETFQGQRALQA